MRGWKRPSDHGCGALATAPALASALAALALLPLFGGCAPRALVVVVSCPDGATGETCPQNPDPTLREGLVGLWHFDEVAGSSIAADASGNGNDGKLIDLDPATAW